MDERKQRILRAIIEDYVKSAEPVGSRTIAKNYNLGISPATVRNEMADLEDLGYLEKPHTSAGRIPSSKGYRLYVDSMMHQGPVENEDVKQIHSIWNDPQLSGNEMLLHMARLVSQISHSMSLLLAPGHDQAMLKYIHILPLDAHQAVMVVITATGALDNELMYFTSPVKADELQLLAIQFSNAVQNKLLRDITSAQISAIIAHIDGSKSVSLQIGETLLRAITKRRLFYSVGTTELLRQPEFKTVEKVQPVLSLLEEQQELGHILQDNSNKPIKIKIGSENQMEALSDMSLIQTDFSQDNNQLGTLAILGPTRMEYSRIINMLSYMKHLMETMARNQT